MEGSKLSRSYYYAHVKNISGNFKNAGNYKKYPHGNKEYWKGVYNKLSRREKKQHEVKKKKVKPPDVFDFYIKNGNNNKIFSMIINQNKLLSVSQADRFYNNLRATGMNVMLIKMLDGTEETFTISQNAYDFFIYITTQGKLIMNEQNEFESDGLAQIDITEIMSINILPMRVYREIKNKNGRFFPYINTSGLDLSRYQIYDQEQAYNVKTINAREHCLMNTLLQSGVDKTLVNQLKINYNSGTHISKKDLTKIAKLINRNIVVHNYIGIRLNKKRFKSINSDKKDINIAMSNNHYFLFEKTHYSKFSIGKYKLVKDEPKFYNIIIKKGKYFYRDPNKAKISSLLLVKKFQEQNYFKKLDLSKFQETGSHAETKHNIYLNNIQNEQRPVKPNKEKEMKQRNIIYADTETNVSRKEHKLMLIAGVSDETDKIFLFNIYDELYSEKKEQSVVYKFLNKSTSNGTKDALIYFHNLKYDYTILERYLNIRKKCTKDGNMYNVVCSYKGCEIEFRDSYKLLSFSLKKLCKDFNLPKEICKKEAISYKYYEKHNNGKRIKTKRYRKQLSNNDKLVFDEVIKDELSYDPKNQTFNPWSYYKKYLRYDCLSLKAILKEFNKLIMKITYNEETKKSITIYDCLTISSLTDSYMRNQGVYDGVYEVTGNLRAYIGKAVYGGRVCVNEKYKKKVIEEKMSDYDGVSLYPSAIKRLCDEIGLPTGAAKRFKSNELNEWKNKIYSVLTIKINKVNKIQQMPFIAVRSEGSIKYTNEAPEQPFEIDNTGLEDLIKFHNIEYEVLDGVYWDEGVNKKMGKVIQKLFNARQEYRETNKALANTLKLMLNSSYGKTIMKQSNTRKQIIKESTNKYNKETKKWEKSNSTNFNDFVCNNFNTIKSYRKLNDNTYEIEMICADFSYNRAHVGCSILSMSKRIMNEVFDVANTLKVPIYYTDTDSLHCRYEDVSKIEEAYFKTYNKKLNGNQLGQFHTDFDLDGACDEIYATKSIFLGKKSYLDVLESKDKNGEKITGYHIRLKGITKEGILHQSKKYKEGALGLFKDLANGKQIQMIMNPFNVEANSQKVLFDFKNGRVSTKSEFKRMVSF